MGINPGHNGSVAVVSDGKLVYYLEEERLSKIKYEGNPFRVMTDICSKYKIDEIVIGGTNTKNELPKLSGSYRENVFHDFITKYNKKAKMKIANLDHHLLHATSAFINSNFHQPSIIVIDGAGSFSKTLIKNEYHEFFECESIFNSTPEGLIEIYKSVYSYFGDTRKSLEENNIINIGDSATITKSYEGVTKYLGWHPIEAGKTMGLAPYGKLNPNIPKLFRNGRGDKNVFIPVYPAYSILDEKNNPIFQRNHDPKEWHTDPSKLTEIEADLAWQIQNDTQEEVAKLIEKSVELTGNKQICIAGGYGLNCVTNYWLKKRFPDLEIYHEPISHDGGIAVGAAYLGWLIYCKENNIEPQISNQTSIYYGPEYTTNQYLETLKSYNTMFNQYKISPEQVAKLISERNSRTTCIR